MSPLLQAYLDGQVDELSARRGPRHLDACRRCGPRRRSTPGSSCAGGMDQPCRRCLCCEARLRPTSGRGGA
ncbi:MAG: hypothetical protein M3P53_10305 [Actinomycetota bacterium]|nr:hypothetical protein [Actinomycetota bacterium]